MNPKFLILNWRPPIVDGNLSLERDEWFLETNEEPFEEITYPTYIICHKRGKKSRIIARYILNRTPPEPAGREYDYSLQLTNGFYYGNFNYASFRRLAQKGIDILSKLMYLREYVWHVDGHYKGLNYR